MNTEVLNVIPDDQELISKAQTWVIEGKSYAADLRPFQQRNEDYYLGKQTKSDRIPPHLSNLVLNRVFECVETILPIVTAKPAEFITKSPDNSELGTAKAAKLRKVLTNLYETTDVADKLEDAVRHKLLYRYGCLKVVWDADTDDVSLRVVRPQRLLLPKRAGMPWIIENLEMGYQEILDFFGEETAKLLAASNTDEDTEKRTWTIREVWTDYWRAYLYENRVLQKEKNPYYRDGGYFETPRKPYIFLMGFNLGKDPLPETTMVEQAIPIQDAINSTGRIIINHAAKMGNAVWRIDNQCMTKEEADRITNQPGLVIYGNGVASDQMVRRDAPPPLPAYLFQMWAGLNKSMDDLFGLHSTTRGSREGRETAQGRLILKQADLGRLDYIVREIDRTIAEIGQWYAQLIKLFYTDEKTIKILGPTDAEFVKVSNRDIEQGAEIQVRSGSTLPSDEVSEAQNAIELWRMGAIDPISLFEKLKDPNPLERAKRLMQWKTGQLIPGMAPPAPPGAAGAVAPGQGEVQQQ